MKKTTINRFDGMVVGLFFLVYTLLVHARVLPTLSIEEEIYGLQSITEMFHQFKSQVLVVVAVALVIGLLLSLLTGETSLRGDRLFLLCIGGYGILSFISYGLSAHKDLAWRGGIDRYEGLPALISYAIVAVCFYFASNESRAKLWFLRFFAVNNLLIYLMGLFQTAGYNLLNQEWFLRLIIWPAQDVVVESVGLSATRAAYATFGNQNFMGSYAIISVLLNLYIFHKSNTQRSKLLWGGLAILGLSTLLCSYSLAGMVGFIVAYPLLIAYLTCSEYAGREILATVPVSVVPLGIFLTIAPEMDRVHIISYVLAWALGVFAHIIKVSIAKNGVIINYRRAKYGIYASLLLLVFAAVGIVSTLPRLEPPLRKVEVIGQSASLVMHGTEITIEYQDPRLILTEEKTGKEHTITAPGEITLTTNSDKRIEAMYFKDRETEGVYGLAFKDPYLVFMMGKFNDKPIFSLVGNGSRAIEPEVPKRVSALDGLERLGSGRGYILSRTAALLPNYLLIGAGPDNFPAVFPQRDVTGKSTISNPYLIIDKPHNWYLQMAVNTGVIGMLCIVTSIILLVRKALLSVFGHKDQLNEIAVVLTLVCVGYAVTSLFNDSVVSVAPIFWAALGCAHGLFDRTA